MVLRSNRDSLRVHGDRYQAFALGWLQPLRLPAIERGDAPRAERSDGGGSRPGDTHVEWCAVDFARWWSRLRILGADSGSRSAGNEIGRASCRDRVSTSL